MSILGWIGRIVGADIAAEATGYAISALEKIGEKLEVQEQKKFDKLFDDSSDKQVMVFQDQGLSAKTMFDVYVNDKQLKYRIKRRSKRMKSPYSIYNNNGKEIGTIYGAKTPGFFKLKFTGFQAIIYPYNHGILYKLRSFGKAEFEYHPKGWKVKANRLWTEITVFEGEEKIAVIKRKLANLDGIAYIYYKRPEDELNMLMLYGCIVGLGEYEYRRSEKIAAKYEYDY